jgi:hypothetical protein
MIFLDDLIDDLKTELPTGTKVINWYTYERFIFRMINDTIR